MKIEKNDILVEFVAGSHRVKYMSLGQLLHFKSHFCSIIITKFAQNMCSYKNLLVENSVSPLKSLQPGEEVLAHKRLLLIAPYECWTSCLYFMIHSSKPTKEDISY